MQKIINVIAVSSGIVSAAVIASGVLVYVNRDSIIDNIKSQAMEAVTGSLGGLGGGLGAPDLGTPDVGVKVPSAGLGVPTF